MADNDAVGTVSADSSPTSVVTGLTTPATPAPPAATPSPAPLVELLAPVKRQNLAGGGQRVVTRLALREPGRYTFIYLVSKREGRKIVLIVRLLTTSPKSATLRIVLKRAD